MRWRGSEALPQRHPSATRRPPPQGKPCCPKEPSLRLPPGPAGTSITARAGHKLESAKQQAARLTFTAAPVGPRLLLAPRLLSGTAPALFTTRAAIFEGAEHRGSTGKQRLQSQCAHALLCSGRSRTAHASSDQTAKNCSSRRAPRDCRLGDPSRTTHPRRRRPRSAREATVLRRRAPQAQRPVGAVVSRAVAVSDGAYLEQLFPGSEVPAPPALRLRTSSLVAAARSRGRTMDVNQPKQEHLLALKGTGVSVLAGPSVGSRQAWAPGAALARRVGPGASPAPNPRAWQGPSCFPPCHRGAEEGRGALRGRVSLRGAGGRRRRLPPGLAGCYGLFAVFAVCRQASAVPTFFFFFFSNCFSIFFLVP